MRMSTLVALALLVFCWSPQTIGQKLVQPPFVRKWTAMTGDNVVVFAVRSGVVYYCSHEGVGALDLATGQPKWRCLANSSTPAAVLQGSTPTNWTNATWPCTPC